MRKSPGQQGSRAGPDIALRSLRALGLDWLILFAGVSVAAASPAPLMLWFCSLVVGVHLHRLAIIGHDGAHRLIWPKSPQINDWISNILVFFPLVATVDGYRRWHLSHHARTGTHNDPEKVIKQGRLYARPMMPSGFVLMFIGDLLGLGIPELLRLAWVSRPTSRGQLAGLVVWWAVFLPSLVYLGGGYAVACYVLGLATSFWAVFRLRNWSEHVGAQNEIRTHRFDASPVVAYAVFPYNTFMHWEHHKEPWWAWYDLPVVRRKYSAPAVLSVSRLWRMFSEA